jgi:hypothetical protein
VAYQSDETRGPFNFEIYVQPYPSTGAKYQISKGSTRLEGGGQNPLWSLDGRELFYQAGGKLMVVRVLTQPSFSFANPSALPIEGFNQPTAGGARNYDITPDGKQFIMVLPADRNQSARRTPLQIQVVLNWFEELKQLVPVK